MAKQTKCQYCGGAPWTRDNGYHVRVNSGDVCSAEYYALTGSTD